MLRLLAVGLMLVLLLAGCGEKSEPPLKSIASSTPSATETPAPGLVGLWKTTNVCKDELRALRAAHLPRALVSKWIRGGEYPGNHPTRSNPCRGAKPMEHSHRFGEDGSFASYDQDGKQVDDDDYDLTGDHAFVLDKPIEVKFVIDGDKATFTTIKRRCSTKKCREALAYTISAFFPREYTRGE